MTVKSIDCIYQNALKLSKLGFESMLRVFHHGSINYNISKHVIRMKIVLEVHVHDNRFYKHYECKRITDAMLE